jgi:hypothetical protein
MLFCSDFNLHVNDVKLFAQEINSEYNIVESIEKWILQPFSQ